VAASGEIGILREKPLSARYSPPPKMPLPKVVVTGRKRKEGETAKTGRTEKIAAPRAAGKRKARQPAAKGAV